eukprot:3726835-Lingulodinium_polyedra.AAC.1
MGLSDEELLGNPARPAVLDDESQVAQPAVEADSRAGVRRVLRRLETSLTPELAVRRGASMNDFFGARKFHRRVSERVNEFST